jgi:hypothetical protein
MPSYPFDDGYPDDWIASPLGVPPPAPGPQFGAAHPDIAGFASQPDWAGAFFPGQVWTPPTRPAFRLPPELSRGGLLGGLAGLDGFGQGGILGGLADFAPATPTWAPGLLRDSQLIPLPNANGLYQLLSYGSNSSPVAQSSGGNDAALNWGLSDDSGSSQSDTRLAQSILLGLPPSLLFTKPPGVVVPPRELTPLEELPPGSSGGDSAYKVIRPTPDDYPEGAPCGYCGQPTTRVPGRPNTLERDHIFPRSRGGNTTDPNRLPTCRTCNRQKGQRTPLEWYKSMQEKDGL